MVELSIRVSSDGAPDAEAAEALRAEIDETVGDVRRPEATAVPGQKGAGLAEIAQVAVLLASAPAVPKLIEVLASYLQRDRRLQFEFEGPKGKVKISTPDQGLVSRDDIARAIRQAIGDDSHGA